MAKTMKMTKLEEYTQQKQQAREVAANASKRIAQADEEYQALKAEYERVVRESLASGTDNADERSALADRVEQAERQARRLRNEAAMTNSGDIVKVTPDDLIAEFRTTTGPAFKAARVTPALEAVRAAKIAYANAVFEYKRVEDEFKDVAGEYIDELGESYRYKFAGVLPATRQEIDRYFLRPGDVDRIQSGQVPASLTGEVQR